MHKRQSQHGGTACDEEAVINLGWFVQEGGAGFNAVRLPCTNGRFNKVRQ